MFLFETAGGVLLNWFECNKYEKLRIIISKMTLTLNLLAPTTVGARINP